MGIQEVATARKQDYLKNYYTHIYILLNFFKYWRSTMFDIILTLLNMRNIELLQILLNGFN